MVDAARSKYQKQGIKNDEDLQVFWSQGLKQEDLDWQIALPLGIELTAWPLPHKAEAHFLERKNQLDQVVYSLLRVKDRFLPRSFTSASNQKKQTLQT